MTTFTRDNHYTSMSYEDLCQIESTIKSRCTGEGADGLLVWDMPISPLSGEPMTWFDELRLYILQRDSDPLQPDLEI